ncbi:hypothetical protein L2E82_44509 [Cichorium intybus]|uniref:Uncharacterized protein n=1 Tax=Cichorium intybus TaxID=13427 RepID=A0ACB8ZQ06_CICIN|nr:hypothetical protein L2E82_44509 [Cichorium intybus]
MMNRLLRLLLEKNIHLLNPPPIYFSADNYSPPLPTCTSSTSTNDESAPPPPPSSDRFSSASTTDRSRQDHRLPYAYASPLTDPVKTTGSASDTPQISS